MYQNYPYYQQQPPQQPRQLQYQPQVTLKGRPVTSFEEVKASAVDFDGSIFFFPDIANKRIYTKQIAMDGSALLNMYELKQIPIENLPSNETNYITREEFESAISQLRSLLSNKPEESNFNF